MIRVALFVLVTQRVLLICLMDVHNFYSRRHDRIVGKLFDEIKLILCSRKKLYTNKLLETLLPEYREELTLLQHRKPDIVIIDEISRDIIIAEVTVCFDLYFEYSFQRSVIATRICVTFFVKKDGTLLFMYCVLVRLAVSKRTFMNDCGILALEKQK